MNVQNVFNEALANLDLLDEHNLPDDQPHLEVHCYNPLDSTEANFKDMSIYSNILNIYCEDAYYINDLINIIQEGKELTVMLYTWRCCSRAIPLPKSNEQPNRVEIYEKTVEVLAPEVRKLFKLMYFYKKSMELFINEIKRLSACNKYKPYLNETYLLTLGRLIELFLNLDELKNMKSSIKNDYSAYRRAAQFLKVINNSEALQESQNLSMFLANQNKIRISLKSQLEQIDYNEEILYEIIRVCSSNYERGFFITPSEKHMLIKVIAFSLNLMDSERFNMYNPKQSSSANNKTILNTLDLSLNSSRNSNNRDKPNFKKSGSSTLNSLALMNSSTTLHHSSSSASRKKLSGPLFTNYGGSSSTLYTVGLNSTSGPINFAKLDRIIGNGPRFLPLYIAGNSAEEIGCILSNGVTGVDDNSNIEERVDARNPLQTSSPVNNGGNIYLDLTLQPQATLGSGSNSQLQNNARLQKPYLHKPGLIGTYFATDMQINLFASYIATSPNYDSSKWPVCNASTSNNDRSNLKHRSAPTETFNKATGETFANSVADHADGLESSDLVLESSSSISTSSRNKKYPLHPLLTAIHHQTTTHLDITTNQGIAMGNVGSVNSNPISSNVKRTVKNLGVKTLFQAFDPFFTFSWSVSSCSHQSTGEKYRQYRKPLVVELTLAREMFTAYTMQLSSYINQASLCQTQRVLSDSQNRELKDLALKGLLLLTHWNCVISETHSTKLMNPTDSNKNIDCPPNAEDYERAIKYNYGMEEKLALIEMITYVKSLQAFLVKATPLFRESILRNVYAELQETVQSVIREPLRKSIKNKKETIKNILIAIRETCADTPNAYDPNIDPMFKGKKDNSIISSSSIDSTGPFEVIVPRKSVPPSHSQLYIVRALFEMLISENYPYGAKKGYRKEFDTQTITYMENFLKISYFWSHLLNFNGLLNECADLSYLWYREFYLEMTMGKRIQFPIDMSTPWILCSTILRLKKPSLIESLFYVLGLYNDSANISLMHLRKRYLYDEIEAEVNLCFDQLVYLLSEQIYSYYKQLAACIIIDKRFNEEFSVYGGNRINFPPAHRYHALLKQRHIQLLGRWIDLNRLLNQRIYLSFKKSLSIAVDNLESDDITGILDFDLLVEINRLTYSFLSEYFCFPDFELLLNESLITNHNSSPTAVRQNLTDNNNNNPKDSHRNRLISHITSELLNDFIPNYLYNSTTNRFVRTKEINFSLRNFKRKQPPVLLSPAYLWGTKALTSAYGAYLFPFKGFIGSYHFRLFCRYLGYDGIATVVLEIIHKIEDLINGDLLQHMRILMNMMPKQSKLLRYDYGSAGILAYYQAQLKDILKYPELKTGTFQLFREIGNCILIALCLEKNLFEEETLDLLQASVFQNVMPRPFCAEGEKLEQKLKILEAKCNALNIAINVEKFGSAKQTLIARENDLLTKEKLCCGLSIFQTVLTRVCKCLSDSPKLLPLSTNFNNAFAFTNYDDRNTYPSICLTRFDSCLEFHRLWSALQLIWCIPVGENEFTIEQLYGESINWAGCTFIHLLNQQNRFETLDFSYHLLKVQRVDNCTGDEEDKRNGGINLKRMADRIRKFQVLNGQIFSTLNRYLDQGSLKNLYLSDTMNPSDDNSGLNSTEITSPDLTNDVLQQRGRISTNLNSLENGTAKPVVEHIQFFQPPLHELTLQNS